MTTPTQNAHSGNGLVSYTPQHGGGMVMPIATPEQARLAIDAFENLKSSLASPSDMIMMKGGRIFLRKPFWRRVARAFGLDVQLVSEDRRIDTDGAISYSVLYRATAPNGSYMDGDGFCSTSELSAPTDTEHNCRARAHTRAKNRAISDLVGGGEVSADELTDEELDEVRRNTSGGSQQRQQQPPQQQRKAVTSPAAAPAAAPATRSPWNAMLDVDVASLLNHMEIRGQQATHSYLQAVRAEMKAQGLAWVRDQVLAELRDRVKEFDEEDAASGELYPDANLADIDTGAPGN